MHKSDVTHYHQQAVTEIVREENGYWGLVFESGARIMNETPEVPIPSDEIVGLALLTTVFAPEANEVVLKFGRAKINPRTQIPEPEYIEDVTLDPMNYRIEDPTQGSVYPGRADQEEEPPDMSERTQDAPEGWEEALEMDKAAARERVGIEAKDQIIDKAKVIENKDGQWHVQAVSDNGEIIATTENYTQKNYAVAVAKEISSDVEIIEYEEVEDDG